MTILLDGPMGTELARRGVSTDGRAWSATALDAAPDVVRAIHQDYARAGSTVHTANTFRTTRRALGSGWRQAARLAVELAREAVPADHRIAGSIAPLEDCYRPDLSPADPGPEHAELAEVLAGAGCDLLLCETFPHPGEALAALDAALATGLETWLALTAGPNAGLMAPDRMLETARAAVGRGAAIVLVDCVPALRIGPWVDALAASGLPWGVYANAGYPRAGIGWGTTTEGPARYAALAARWIAAGATVVGGCCGTGPEHIRAIRDAVFTDERQRTG